MKKIIYVLLFCLMLVLSGCSENEPIPAEENNPLPEPESEISDAEEDVPYINGWTADFRPSDFESYEEYEKAFFDEYVKQLQPLEFFETEKEYPEVILETFDLIMAKETPEFLKCDELLEIKVLGDENEFYVSYRYITMEGVEEVLSARIRKTEDGKYGLLGRGGGAPLGHGLEKTDITLEDIKG